MNQLCRWLGGGFSHKKRLLLLAISRTFSSEEDLVAAMRDLGVKVSGNRVSVKILQANQIDDNHLNDPLLEGNENIIVSCWSSARTS